MLRAKVSVIRRLAWCGMNASRSSIVSPACSTAARATSAIANGAHRKTEVPPHLHERPVLGALVLAAVGLGDDVGLRRHRRRVARRLTCASAWRSRPDDASRWGMATLALVRTSRHEFAVSRLNRDRMLIDLHPDYQREGGVWSLAKKGSCD